MFSLHQDLRADFQPLMEKREQCYCFVIVPLFRYFFAV